MDRFRYDRTSKWLVEHQGDMMLRLGGVTDIESWRPLQAEVVQPRQLPDGLLEVHRAGESRAELFVVEIFTYPDRRIAEQVLDDVMLVYQDRRVLPEVLVLVLCPKGHLAADEAIELHSRLAWTRLGAGWRVVRLWDLRAEDLLATGEAGLMPWVPLARIDGPPEVAFRQCRRVIDEKAKAGEHDNLLAVTEVLAGLRYDDPRLLSLFGGKEAMIESPVLQRFLAEHLVVQRQRDIQEFLEGRFGPLPPELIASLQCIADADRLAELVKRAATCPDLESFQQQLQPSQPQ